MKKRFLAMMLCLCMALSLAGCGLAATQAPDSGNDSGSELDYEEEMALRTEPDANADARRLA